MAEIQEMKEKLRQENESLKKLKQSLKEVQDKQKLEKEVKVLLTLRVLTLYYCIQLILICLFFRKQKIKL